VVFKLQSCSWATVTLINTAQHRELLDDMLSIFRLKPDFDLNIMQENQSLSELTAHLCTKLDELFSTHRFDAVLGVGDTTSVMVASLIAFYHKISFGHIEAGLRTFDRYQPFPEEVNRTLISKLATWHFVPTQTEQENLLKENISSQTIFVTGNTVIDALYWTLEHTQPNTTFSSFKRYIIVTAHRRENFGEGLKSICNAIITLSKRFTDVDFIIPVHPNPNVKRVVSELLAHQSRIHLVSSLKYDEFAHLMQHCMLILTDSGGIQEEAPALHKPVIVMREVTERPAIIDAGVGVLAGTHTEEIVNAVSTLLTDNNLYEKMSNGLSPYGDGHAARRIVEILRKVFMDEGP
jgi:UDP-N-acetylglucosamine 2-epimerase (non-hydrolysing)